MTVDQFFTIQGLDLVLAMLAWGGIAVGCWVFCVSLLVQIRTTTTVSASKQVLDETDVGYELRFSYVLRVSSETPSPVQQMRKLGALFLLFGLTMLGLAYLPHPWWIAPWIIFLILVRASYLKPSTETASP